MGFLKLKEAANTHNDKVSLNELAVFLHGGDYFYFKTRGTSVYDALEDFLGSMDKVGIDYSNIKIKKCILRDSDYEDIEERSFL